MLTVCLAVPAIFLLQYAPMLFAGLLPQLHSLLQGSEPDLQQLAAQLLALCAKEQRKRGMLLAASPDAATAKLVKQQLLPCMRQLVQGRSSAAAAGRKPNSKRKQPADGSDDELDPMDEDDADAEELDDSQAAAAAVCNPRAAKWATYAIAYCQDHSSARAELSRLAADLAGSLDSGEPEGAAKLQALSTIGRLLPGERVVGRICVLLGGGKAVWMWASAWLLVCMFGIGVLGVHLLLMHAGRCKQARAVQHPGVLEPSE
jgi:hypothetical protein